MRMGRMRAFALYRLRMDFPRCHASVRRKRESRVRCFSALYQRGDAWVYVAGKREGFSLFIHLSLL